MVDDEAALSFLRRVVKEYSPSGREEEVASELEAWLRSSSSFDRIERDEAGNVLAYSGPGPYFLLCSHMDTVPGRLPVADDGCELKGRGAVDAKASLVAMCVAASELPSAGRKNLMFAGVVHEETDGKGIKALLSRKLPYIGGVFGEPSGRCIVVGYRGRVGFELLATGRAAHASSAALGSNAIESAIHAASELKEALTTLGCATSMTVIEGGVADNVIPDRCKVSFDTRVPPDVRLDIVMNAIQRRTQGSVATRILEVTPPVSVGRANATFRAMAEAVRAAGAEPKAVFKVGTSDMNNFFIETRAPCVAYGPGDPSLSHSDHEAISYSDFIEGIRVYSLLIQRATSPRG